MSAPDGPRYRLQPLLEVRDQAVQDAVNQLARRRDERLAAEGRLAACAAALRAVDAELGSQRDRARARAAGERDAAELTPALWQRERRYLRRLQAERERAVAAVDRARAAVEAALRAEGAAQAALAQARQEREVLAQHKARGEAEQRVAAARRAEEAQDELAAARHVGPCDGTDGPDSR